MLVSLTKFKKNILKRMEPITMNELNMYWNALFDLIKERIANDNVVIIDNFGTLSRKLWKKKKVLNVNTREKMEIIPTRVVLIPNLAFIKYIKDPQNIKWLKKRIVEASERAMIECSPNRRKLT